jgi:hypothetical protein
MMRIDEDDSLMSKKTPFFKSVRKPNIDFRQSDEDESKMEDEEEDEEEEQTIEK